MIKEKWVVWVFVFLLSLAFAETSFAAPGESCIYNWDCDQQTEFCSKTVGNCDNFSMVGTCETIPDPTSWACPMFADPVCGCNNVIYSNACFAYVAGVNLDSLDQCTSGFSDSDFDGVPDHMDICPGYPDRLDADMDGVPVGCDFCTGNDATGDSDADGICDNLDICTGTDASGDTDGDGICNDIDPQTCQNGIVEAPEQCDDNNQNNLDFCSNLCTTNLIQSYVVDMMFSYTDTTGGIGGSGVGTLGLGGSLAVLIAEDQIKFNNLSVVDIPNYGFQLPEYPAFFDGLNFNGTQLNGNFPDNIFSGESTILFGEQYISVDGEYHQPYADGFNFSYHILAFIDSDADGSADMADYFPLDPFEQTDSDGDGIGDNADICSLGDDRLDADHDGIPDACDLCRGDDSRGDMDNDGVCNDRDNCPSVANTDQADTNRDGMGNACSPVVPKVGSPVDAPHNKTFGMRCSDCHSYQLWWQYPPYVTSGSVDPVVETICITCHDPNNPNIPYCQPHSNTVTMNPFYIYHENCIKCHDPHFQKQLNWIGTEPGEILLAKATIDNFDFYYTTTVIGTEEVDVTTFQYSGLVVNSPNWSSPLSWGNKDINNPLSRGLMLVVDVEKLENTFQVIGATDSAITVRGIIDPVYAGRSFGLFFGQLLNDRISTIVGDRDVLFTEPQDGGFVEFDNSPTRGLCQVCHTETTIFRNDGALPAGISHSGYLLHDCTICHENTRGFDW